jgi:hypothetical protein
MSGKIFRQISIRDRNLQGRVGGGKGSGASLGLPDRTVEGLSSFPTIQGSSAVGVSLFDCFGRASVSATISGLARVSLTDCERSRTQTPQGDSPVMIELDEQLIRIHNKP